MNCWDNLPDKFRERAKDIISKEKHQVAFSTFCADKPISIRINTLVTTKQEVNTTLSNVGIATENIPWYSDALLITSGTKEQIAKTSLYTDGHIYFQNLSSMLPGVALNPKPNEKILDMAAAPGSKTSHIAQMMNNTGEIIANDISRQRLFKLKSVLTQFHISNVKISQIPGEFIWRKYPNYFDKVLVDAPCSMEGRFKANDPKTYKDWSPKKIKVLSFLQKRLLRSAFYATKQGGIIVYSTCTLSPEENEDVINWLLLEEKSHVELMDLAISFDSPLKTWKRTTYLPEIKKTLRVIPSNSMEGFFLAKIKRLS